MESYRTSRLRLQQHDDVTNRLKEALKGKSKSARRAAMAAALTVPLTDRQRGQGR